MTQEYCYRFEVIYQTKQLAQVSRFMDALDLSMGEICFEETYKIYTSVKQSASKVKDIFTKAMESAGWKVMKIEGGLIE